MSDAFDQFLSGELEAIEAAGLLRTLRRMESPQQIEVKAGGQELINFSSNDYGNLTSIEDSYSKLVKDTSEDIANLILAEDFNRKIVP